MLNKFTFLSFLLLILSPVLHAKTHQVDIKKFQFIPQQLTIAVGDTVIWTNSEKRQYHSVWVKSLFSEEPEYFFPDETYQLTFKQAGEFPYICGPHPKMTGTISVK